MQNAVIYARFSSHGQNEQSIDGQVEECQQYCEQMGFNVVGIYHDNAISGKFDEKRSDFMQMIADSKTGLFQYIVVWKLDRFARNRYDSAIYKKDLSKRGIRVLSAKQQISPTNEGIFYEAILEANDEYYSLNLSTNVKRGQRQSVEKGLFIGGHTLFGYKINKTPVGNHYESKVEIDEKNAPIVQFIFEEYASGTPKKVIVDKLNAKGYKNFNGKPFHINNFQNTLTNRKYTGEYYFGENKQFNDNTYPPLISKELFNKVQERLKANKRAPAKAKAIIDYLLTGKAYCGHCGSPIVGTSGTGKMGNKFYYYNCSTKYKYHTCKKCAEKKGFLEWYVTEQTLEYVLQPARMDYIAGQLVEAYKRTASFAEIKSLESRISEVEKSIEKAVNAMIDATSSATRKLLDQKIADFEFLQNGLKNELLKLKAMNKANFTKKDIIAQLKLFCNGDPLDPEFQKRIIDGIVNSIYVYDDRILFYYNLHSAKQVSFIDNANIAENAEKTGDLATNIDEGKCSYLKCLAPPSNVKYEHQTQKVYYVFVDGLFGIVIYRKNTDK